MRTGTGMAMARGRDDGRRADVSVGFGPRRREVRPLERLRCWARVDGHGATVQVGAGEGSMRVALVRATRPKRGAVRLWTAALVAEARVPMDTDVPGVCVSRDVAIQLAAELVLSQLRTSMPGGGVERHRDPVVGPQLVVSHGGRMADVGEADGFFRQLRRLLGAR